MKAIWTIGTWDEEWVPSSEGAVPLVFVPDEHRWVPIWDPPSGGVFVPPSEAPLGWLLQWRRGLFKNENA